MDLMENNTTFDRLQDGDLSGEVVGYVTDIYGSMTVGRLRKYQLFRFILDNGYGQKLLILIWDDLINHYAPNITLNQVNLTMDLSENSTFDHLVDRDKTAEVIGYVCEIYGTSIVGKSKQYSLFKFVLNNGSNKKLMVCIWDDPLINRHSPNIKINEVN
ncbi:hypothetical protein TKK_0011506 [Trichogramma kaykai]|uniref:Uncharacterized protein n=1 Tax=Trichogramma kaykai TaxID=54128 RepID=A0ABD2WQM6_9HYME